MQEWGFSSECVCIWFLTCFFLRKPSDIDDIDAAFHLNVFFYAFWNWLHVRRLFDIDYKDIFSQWSVFISYCWLLTYGLSSEWVFMCILKFPFTENLFGHWLHGNGFSLECVRMCILKMNLTGKAFEHWGQGNGFLPECVLICTLKWPAYGKAIGHRLQACSFSPECDLMCIFNLCPSLKAFGH